MTTAAVPLPAAIGSLHVEYSSAADLPSADIPVYDMSVDSEAVKVGGSSAGVGVTRVVFNPLSLELPVDGAVPGLFSHLASGTAFKKFTLTLYAPGATTTALVQSFDQVSVKTQSITSTDRGPKHVVTFEYSSTGFIVDGHRAGWNSGRNAPCTPALADAPSDPCAQG